LTFRLPSSKKREDDCVLLLAVAVLLVAENDLGAADVDDEVAVEIVVEVGFWPLLGRRTLMPCSRR
jgi:hypothetical protein